MGRKNAKTCNSASDLQTPDSVNPDDTASTARDLSTPHDDGAISMILSLTYIRIDQMRLVMVRHLDYQIAEIHHEYDSKLDDLCSGFAHSWLEGRDDGTGGWNSLEASILWTPL